MDYTKVHPDSQLVKTSNSNRKKQHQLHSLKKKTSDRLTNRPVLKLKELSFSEQKNQTKKATHLRVQDDEIFKTPDMNRTDATSFSIRESVNDDLGNNRDLACDLFGSNTTIFSRDLTLMSPRKHKVYVEDTPVDCYGMSLKERREKGFHI